MTYQPRTYANAKGGLSRSRRPLLGIERFDVSRGPARALARRAMR